MKKENYTLFPKPYTLTIGWLYPELMSTYGDGGNIMVLQKRCEWRGIRVKILPIDQSTLNSQLSTLNLLFGGGAQDKAQEIIIEDLRKKARAIKNLIENNIPALFVCGAPQLFGSYYETAEGKRIEGLGIFDMVSKHPGPKAKRLIGNLIAKIQWQNFKILNSRLSTLNSLIVGFENHGGRTYLGKHAKPFAKVIKGFGNNGEDGTEGVVYKNAIGCYLHGPLLPKNPVIADYLIQKALEVKYKKAIILEPLPDSLEQKAQEVVLQKLGVKLHD